MIRLPALTAMLLVFATSTASADHDHECMLDVSKAHTRPATALPMQSAHNRGDDVTVYLNRHRTTLSGGWDNAAGNSSQLVYSRGFRAFTAPGFTGSRTSWNRVVSCVREGLRDFNVNVVDQRPASGDYIMAMVGGRSSMLGYRGSISGVAPYGGKLLPNAVLFVFARGARNRVASVCQTTLHEIGHTLGLDHTYYGPDTMSYLRTRSKKTFRDRDMACGEFRRRACGTGERTQNSYQRLASAVGLRAGPGDHDDDTPAPPPLTRQPPVEPPPIEETPPTHRPPAPPPTTTRMPTVDIVSPRVGETVLGDGYVHIILRASGSRGISKVELAWAMGDSTTHVLECGRIPRNLPATCSRDGEFYSFSLKVGVGTRAFAVRVTDGLGNQIVTKPRTLHLGAVDDDSELGWDDDED